ncbi:hypothetical protein AB0M29_13690 [Streptomyces sp. NPDC051976]|uniref:hypothetical protein n=1 Tax=Streptomyces sp. NPDC051976 TaxID=3154947 RepID=UPI00343EC88C
MIQKLLGHARVRATASVYARVRLRLQRATINLLGRTLQNPAGSDNRPDTAKHLRTSHPLTLPPGAAVNPPEAPPNQSPTELMWTF